MIYIGVDPGMNGAVAIITPNKIELLDAPVISTGDRREYDLDALQRLLPSPSEDIMVNAAIELITPFPKMGMRSAFYLGYGLGLWHQVMVSKGIPFRRVRSQDWKKEFGLLKKNKDASRLRAIELFPQIREQLQRKKDDGRAEALLIGEYLRRVLSGQASRAARTEPTKS